MAQQRPGVDPAPQDVSENSQHYHPPVAVAPSVGPVPVMQSSRLGRASSQDGLHPLHSTARCWPHGGADGRIPSESLASSRDDQRERLRDAYRSDSPNFRIVYHKAIRPHDEETHP